jgi:peptidoglycan/LPS O-acetylase OafA/YrhL
MGGWGKGNFWDGCARISYSFLAGCLFTARAGSSKTTWLFGHSGIAGIGICNALFTKWNWLTEPLVVLFYFPLLVALGAGALSPGLKKLCVFSGNISYPLYMTHYAVIWMFGNYYAAHKPGTGQLAVIIITGMVLLVGFAYLVMVFYDIPVRKYLSAKRKQELSKK